MILVWQIYFLSQIMRKNQIAYHSYADDTQIYLALSPNESLHLETKMKFSRWMHTLTLGVKQLKIKSEILVWFWRQTLVLVVMSKQ